MVPAHLALSQHRLDVLLLAVSYPAQRRRVPQKGPPGLTALTVARPRQLAAPAARVMASSAALGARVHGLALCSPIDDDTLDTLTVRPDQSRGR
ncbi:hypothetical protein MY4038_006097 [Beauveria bassiana]